MIDKLSKDCPDCDNSGCIIIETTGVDHGCCGNVLPTGECCGNSVPVPVAQQEQVQCHWCYNEPFSVFISST